MELRAATPNPYALAAARSSVGHKPPPGLAKQRSAHDASLPASAPADCDEPADEPLVNLPVPASDEDVCPASFAQRGVQQRGVQRLEPRRPIGAARPPPEKAPAEKKEKKPQSIYPQGQSLAAANANPTAKKKRKRIGAPHGPQF